jgi:DNA-binding MarR family transcriptional regulator
MATPERKQVAERLHSAALHLLRRLREADAEAAIGPSRLSALSVLVFGESATLGELAAAEQVTAPTMSKLVAGLEELGLVSRTAGTDRRSVILRATPQGRRLLLKARGRRLERFSAMLAKASSAELATLAKASAIIDRLLSA